MPDDFLEKTLEDIIYENKKIIHTRGFSKLKDNAFRQVVLPSGKKIDIFGFEIKSGSLDCDIYELKREIINADAICQAYNYYIELKHITKDHFASFNAKIIMVGKKYEPVSIIDALPIPIQVYTYEYKIDGIRFKELHNPYVYSKPNAPFSMGLWAFGYAGLTFTTELSSISFHAAYENYSRSKPDFTITIKNHIEHFVVPVKEIKCIEVIEEIVEKRETKSIITEIFPEQPCWTKEFAKSIPCDERLEDVKVDIDCDYEDDELEIDSDYESEVDAEVDDSNYFCL